MSSYPRSRGTKARKRLCPTHHCNYWRVTMTKETVAHLELISQHLISETEYINALMKEAWYTFELLRSDLREFMAVHETWERENVFNHWRRK
ncbi:MAG TPA: hypothetical protein PLY23_03460 [Alphaproteobacteria bacterium]|nr:hypothetical protein [Alphaproteobacteria bacterium]HQS93799.1 hypothetical protein [Alphaproteobacteria bacterium]